MISAFHCEITFPAYLSLLTADGRPVSATFCRIAPPTVVPVMYKKGDDLRQDLGAATLGLTVGIALYPTMGTTPEMLIALAKGERHRRQQEAR